MTTTPTRTADHPIEPVFLNRWSPRAFAETPLAQADLLTVLEAARWAPSAFNAQPWRFTYALRGDAHWQTYLDALLPFNQSWASRAGALVFIVSDSKMRGDTGEAKGDSWSHSFDAGAAWALLAVQATAMGLAAHGMTGFDHEKAGAAIGLPEEYRLEAAVAIGHPGDPAILDEKLRQREQPSGRRPLADSASHGPFPA